MSSEPPGEKGDAPEGRPWLSSDKDVSASEGQSPARKVRMVGSIVDPAVDDGLNLTGPGAPGRSFSNEPAEHPVRARLLEKARAATGETAPTTDEPAPVPSTEAVVGAIGSSDAQSGQPPAGGRLSESGSNAAALVPTPVPEAQAPGTAPTPAPVLPGTPVSTAAPATPHPGAIASELERIARRRSPPPSGPRLSPNLVALLGGLLGLTVISTLGVFLSRTEVQPTAKAPAEEAKDSPEEAKPEPKVERPKREKLPGPWRIADDATKAGHRVLKGRIGKQAFLTAIQEAGLPKSEAYRAYGVLKSELDLDHCKSTDTFLALVKGGDKRLVAFEYIVSKEEVYQVKEGDDGSLEAKQLDLKVGRNQIRRAFTHDGKSFEESARRAGFDPGIADIAEEALRGHAMLSDFKRGDRLRIIAQEVTVLGEFARYAGIEAMEIVSAGEEPLRVYYYPHPVEGGYFDKNGRAPYEGGWRKPIPDAPRTSPFNPKRMHPILKRVSPHNGTDFGCATGTPIGATSPGKISFRGRAGGYGNLIRIKHPGDYESGYAHMSRFEKGLNVGDQVERMQTIGYCGSTGRSTGPHLHFEMKKNGRFIDAESLNLDGLRVLPKQHRTEFAAVRAKYDPILDEIPLPEPLAQPAPSEPASGDASLEESESDEGGMMPDDGPKAAAKPAPQAKPEEKAPPKDPAKAVAPSAIFLSDSELLKMQESTDDGEVPP